MTVAAVASAFPEYRYTQQELAKALREQWGVAHVERLLQRFADATAVQSRHLAMPPERYQALRDFSDRNDVYIEQATKLGTRVLGEALRRADVSPSQLDHIFFVSVTGLATPSIDARLVTALGLGAHIKRTPIFGLGCVAGAAGLSRAADYLRGFPRETVALVAVELCSLTWQSDDTSIPNLIGSTLFGDGAAAVVLRGQAAGPPGPRVVATRSIFYPGTEQVMGWRIGSHGLAIQLTADVPTLVTRHVGGDVDEFLAAQGLGRGDIDSWILHTGGPKVLKAFERTLELPDGALDLTWESLRDHGNLSSVSVLHVLEQTLERRRPRPGQHSVMLAMGPGFCSEMLLLRW